MMTYFLNVIINFPLIFSIIPSIFNHVFNWDFYGLYKEASKELEERLLLVCSLVATYNIQPEG